MKLFQRTHYIIFSLLFISSQNVSLSMANQQVLSNPTTIPNTHKKDSLIKWQLFFF